MVKTTIFLSFVTIIITAFAGRPSNQSTFSTYVNTIEGDYELYSNGELFGDSAIQTAQEIIDFIAEQNQGENYHLVFGIVFIDPFDIEKNLQSATLNTDLANFQPQQIIEDSIEVIKSSYNSKLIDQYVNDHSDFSASNDILIYHNIFIHPYPGNKTIAFTSWGVYTQKTLPDPFTDIELCGEISPTQAIEKNDYYLLNLLYKLLEAGNYYDGGINDKTLSLTTLQKDSISLMMDTVLTERDWNVVVDIFKNDCGELSDLVIDTTAMNDTIQFAIEITEDGDDLSYEMNIFASDNIDILIPTRLRTYIIDSIATPELDQDSLYKAIVNSLDRLRRPLPGDMFFEMRIVNSSGSPNSGGMFGCARGGAGCSSSSIPNLPTYTNKEKVHNGLDIYAALNTDIFAMYDGTVVTLQSGVPANTQGATGAFGNKVRLRHTPAQYGGQAGGDNIYTYYTHLNAVENLSINDQVTQGQKLGETGRTGNAVGIAAWRYHSHINVYIGGTGTSDVVDPRPYLFTQFDNNGNTTN